MSGEVRIDRIEVELEALSAAHAEIVAAAISGALAGQLPSWPLPTSQPQRDDARAGDNLDVDAIAAEIAARILETLAVERERNSEEAAWP